MSIRNANHDRVDRFSEDMSDKVCLCTCFITILHYHFTQYEQRQHKHKRRTPFLVTYHKFDILSCSLLIMEVVSRSFNPSIISISRIIWVTFVYL